MGSSNDLNPSDDVGYYLNYIEMEQIFFLTVVGFDTDQKAIDKAREIFSQKTIVPIKCNEPAKETGILNCLTWNIRK